MSQLAFGMSPVKYADRPRNKSTVGRMAITQALSKKEPRPADITEFAAAQSLLFLSQPKDKDKRAPGEKRGVPALLHRPQPLRLKRPLSPSALSEIMAKTPAIGAGLIAPVPTIAVPTAIRTSSGVINGPSSPFAAAPKPPVNDSHSWRDIEQPGGPYFMLVPRGQGVKR